MNFPTPIHEHIVSLWCAGRHTEAFALARIEWEPEIILTEFETVFYDLSQSVSAISESYVNVLTPVIEQTIVAFRQWKQVMSHAFEGFEFGEQE